MVGRRLAALSRRIPPRSQPFGPRASTLTRNRRLGPSQHDGLDPPMSHSTRQGLCNDTASVCPSVRLPVCPVQHAPQQKAPQTTTDCCTRPHFDPRPQQHGGQQQMRAASSCLQRRRKLNTDLFRVDRTQLSKLKGRRPRCSCVHSISVTETRAHTATAVSRNVRTASARHIFTQRF